MFKFTNYYECPRCEIHWTDVWSCMCDDDDCPECGLTCSPYDSDENEAEEEESK